MKTATIPEQSGPNAVRIRETLRTTGRRLFIRDALKLFDDLVEARFPSWSRARRQARWERKWARPNYKPFWRTEEPQKEIVEAIESGWLPKEGWVYDIGCGSGETSRWLSQQGVHAFGLDFSAAAIEICRRSATEIGRASCRERV